MSEARSEVAVKRESKAPAPIETEGWGPLATLRDEIDRLFDDFSSGFRSRPLSRRVQSLFPTAESWSVSPAMELVDCDGEYQVTAELPGMKPEDVDIKLTDGMITIKGEKSEEKKEKKDDYLLSERRYGSFHRCLTLPAGVDADAISASFSNGVLTVKMTKTPEAKQKERKIEVKAA